METRREIPCLYDAAMLEEHSKNIGVGQSMGQESFLYSFVARGTTILAEFSESSSTPNGLGTVAERCLLNLPSKSNKFTYNYDDHAFFFLVDNGYIYCVVAKDSISQTLSFAYLDRVKADFKDRCGGGKADTATARSLNTEFGPILEEHMKYVISHAEEMDKLSKLNSQVSDIKVIIMENIDKVRDRGENLTNLVDKAEELGTAAEGYKNTGQKVRMHMWFQNMKIKLTVITVTRRNEIIWTARDFAELLGLNEDGMLTDEIPLERYMKE
ncbi:Vesicle-associated membrane protein 724-like protein [Drosera capensis]